MSKKILIISGPTATGKTDLAVKLAQKFNGELVSTDSCQIYKGLDIGTGKDQPSNIPIHLIDLITPEQKFSVAQFQKVGLEIIKKLHSQNKLPVLVGCSGFYLDSLINPNYTTFSIKPNKLLRFILSKFSVKTLQKIYKILDPKNFSKLNNSDINNHYRLTRKIEIKLSNKNTLPSFNPRFNFNILHISLIAPLDFLYHRIDARVQKRLDLGFLNEIKKLLKKYSWTDPGLQIAAYQCLKPYFNHPSPQILSDCLQKWRYAEHSDARRQSTYFKSRYSATAYFFDITQTDFDKKINKLVEQWYTKP
jgi:tRNA dimethylallyltransferase